MRVPQFVLTWLKSTTGKVVLARKPDFLVGGSENPYMRRWWIIPRNKFFNIYLHHFLRSDRDEALHDHPWWNLSILIEGRYVEHTIAAGGVERAVAYEAGATKFRLATAAHRIELDAGPCWSLFITGPVIRDWGFHCRKGWQKWKIEDRGKGGVICD